MGEDMVKKCPSCDEPAKFDSLGHCNECEEIVCRECQTDHFKEHSDPSYITKEEYEELEDVE